MSVRSLKNSLTLALLLLAGCAGTLGVHEGGFNLISLDQEWAMRDDFRRQVAREMTLVRNPQALAYINRLGREIAAQTDLGGLRWDFGIVRDDAVNAFNLPDGLVYVNAGLIREAESLDQLAGVLSHEVAHGAARHGTQLMTRAYGYEVIAGLVLGRDPGEMERFLASVAGTGILMDYSRDAEREADRLGVEYMWKAGYEPRGMPAFFRKLLATGQRKPSHVERFFSSHPITEERIRNVEAAIATLPAKGTLIHDTAEYHKFRARLR